MLGPIFCLFPYGKKRELKILSSPVEAVGFYPGYEVDLLSGEKRRVESKSTISNWVDKAESNDYVFVTHLFYEMGHLKYSDQKKFLSPNTLLGIGLKFPKEKLKNFDPSPVKDRVLLKKKKFISFKNYKEAFDLGRKELMRGNCYQFNLTYPFHFKASQTTKESLIASFSSIEENNRGKFSMLTYIEPLKKAIWSNSPESLFQLKRTKSKTIVQTLPIKGTISLDEAGGKKEAWSKLSSSEKDQAELYMITDLLRNDLNSVDQPTCRVLRKKVPLIAPGIMHQMSLIEIDLPPAIALSRVVDSLFPGGSVTGAPKRRVMEIINRLESRERGAYCGSTMLSLAGRVDCSINIRTAEIDLEKSEFVYSAGGGITVLSDPKSEFEEMMLKLNSFSGLF